MCVDCNVDNVDNVERGNVVYIIGNLKNVEFQGKTEYYGDE